MPKTKKLNMSQIAVLVGTILLLSKLSFSMTYVYRQFGRATGSVCVGLAN